MAGVASYLRNFVLSVFQSVNLVNVSATITEFLIFSKKVVSSLALYWYQITPLESLKASILSITYWKFTCVKSLTLYLLFVYKYTLIAEISMLLKSNSWLTQRNWLRLMFQWKNLTNLTKHKEVRRDLNHPKCLHLASYGKLIKSYTIIIKPDSCPCTDIEGLDKFLLYILRHINMLF